MSVHAAVSGLPDHVDTLVIGAGAAGLSLGRRLALSNNKRDVLVVDARVRYRDDRTWSFWSASDHDLRHLVRHEWNRWKYDNGLVQREHEVPDITYQAIRGIDFYREAQRVIARCSSVQLRLGVTVHDVRNITSHTNGFRIAVGTSHGVVLARHVIDTRPRAARALLYQCFAGSEIDHGGKLSAASNGVAGLMTRMRVDNQGFAFVYVLPLTATTALVEFTRFSRAPIAPAQVALDRDAELRAMGLHTATVLRQETGVLPMGPLGGVPGEPDGVVLAGNAGGALRASTGYAFARIQGWADDCARRMLRGEAPVGHAPEGFIRRHMDRIFLQALRASPERTPAYFMALACGVAPKRLLRFLTDHATLLDLAAIIASLPLIPFLAQLPDNRAAIAAAVSADKMVGKRTPGTSVRRLAGRPVPAQ